MKQVQAFSESLRPNTKHDLKLLSGAGLSLGFRGFLLPVLSVS